MRKKHKKIHLSLGIQLANEAIKVVNTNDFYFFEDDENIREACIKPQKISALHHFLFLIYRFNIVDNLKLRIKEDGEVEHIFELLDEIILEFQLKVKLDQKYILEFDEGRIDILEYEEIIENILYDEAVIDGFVDSAFYILFSDREFLHNFNLGLSNFLNHDEDFKFNYTEYFNKKGKLKRVSFPVWLKEAVLHRDKGVCVKCRRDLTGVINSDFSKHMDHIIPLDYGDENFLGGTNDSSNFQLLCDGCNGRKGSRSTETNIVNIPWWD